MRIYYKRKLLVMLVFVSVALFLFVWSDVSFGLNNKIKINVKNELCSVNFSDDRSHMSNDDDYPMIYFITPTYPRPEQIPELIRLAHTLMHVPKIHWIVADDQPICSQQVSDILRRSGLPYTHISSPKPYIYTTSNFPRGVANRRAALDWLEKNAHSGVFYFGDDDNTIDLQLFTEIRTTQKVSMFPVGLIGQYGVSSPIIVKGKVVGFFDSWLGKRTFPVDMAGFAVNIKYLKPTANMPYKVGLEEDKFLLSLGLKMEDIEPLANNCSKVLVWHTKAKKIKKNKLKINLEQLKTAEKYQDFVKLLDEIDKLGMIEINESNGNKAEIIHNKKMYPLEYLLNLI